MLKVNAFWFVHIITLNYIYIYTHTHRCIKKLNIMKKVNFLSLISESETMYYIDSLHIRGKYFKPLFLEMLMIMAYI